MTSAGSPRIAGGALESIAATSAGRAWAVGCTGCSTRSPATLILAWNGTGWKRIPSPVGASAGELHSVSAASATDAWAAGPASDFTLMILHWDGTAWTRVPTPVPAGGGGNIFGVNATSADVWAVGNDGLGRALILRRAGTRWQRLPSSVGANAIGARLVSVAAASASSAWAVGSDATSTR